MEGFQYSISHRVRILNWELSFIHIIQTRAEKSQLSINKAVKKGNVQQNEGNSVSCRAKGVNKGRMVRVKSGAMERDFLDGKEMGVG